MAGYWYVQKINIPINDNKKILPVNEKTYFADNFGFLSWSNSDALIISDFLYIFWKTNFKSLGVVKIISIWSLLYSDNKKSLGR